MANLSEKFDHWFKNRNTRERFFVGLLGLAILYAIFYLTLFYSKEQQHKELLAEIAEQKNDLNSWVLQIQALKKLEQSIQYKTWLAQKNQLATIREKYKDYILPPDSRHWEDVIKTILSTQSNITTDSVKYEPASVFSTLDLTDKVVNVYQQPVTLTIYGGYFDTLSYLKRLENELPIAQWDRIVYQVTQYPIAKVQVELSILYEKTTQPAGS